MHRRVTWATQTGPAPSHRRCFRLLPAASGVELSLQRATQNVAAPPKRSLTSHRHRISVEAQPSHPSTPRRGGRMPCEAAWSGEP